MTFQAVPVDVVGPQYKSRSLPVSAQTTKNLYPELVPTGNNDRVLMPWPGYTSFATQVSATSACRGSFVMNGVLYQVSDTDLYSIDPAGTRINLGTILGTNQCIFTYIIDNNAHDVLVITTGERGYTYNANTITLAEIVDTDYTPGNSCAYLNNQILYDSNGQSFQISDAGNPSSLYSLNVTTENTLPDAVTRVFVKNQIVMVFGPQSFAGWYNTGAGNPPISRIQNSSKTNIGVGAVHSIADTRDFIYFMGSDKLVYRINQFQEYLVTPPGIANEFSGYTISDAKAFTIRIEGQDFYVIRFPTDGKSYMYCENSDSWTELTNKNSETIYPANSYQYVYGKHLITDATTSAIYELDLDTYDNNGDDIIRERVTYPISAIALDKPGQRLLMNSFEVVMEMGTGLATGQGSDPKMMFEASYDGGKSWTNVATVPIGRTGESIGKVRWFNLASFYEVMIRMTMSDPVFFSIQKATIELQLDGDY